MFSFYDIATLFDLLKNIGACSYINKKLGSNNYNKTEEIMYDIIISNKNEYEFVKFYTKHSSLEKFKKTDSFDDIDIFDFLEIIDNMYDEFILVQYKINKDKVDLKDGEKLTDKQKIHNVLYSLKISIETYNSFSIKDNLMKVHCDYSYCKHILDLDLYDGIIYYLNSLEKYNDENNDKQLWEMWLHKEEKMQWKDFYNKYKARANDAKLTCKEKVNEEKRIFKKAEEIEKTANFKKKDINYIFKNLVK